MPWFPTHAQSQSLLRIIALAVEQRLPLAPLLRAFAEDQFGGQRWRIHRVAGLLEGGSSLPAALEQVARVLPAETVLAIRFGTQSGTLPITLRNLIDESGSLGDVRPYQRLRIPLLYLAVVLLFIVLIGAFLMIYVVPVYIRLLEDVGVESLILQWVVHIGNLIADYWWLAVGSGLFLFWILWTERPGRWLRHVLVRPWCDTRSADVLQNLSIVADAGRPIPGALSTLARHHHDPTLRRKLLFARNEVEHGADLWNTLRSMKLLTPAEVAVMAASDEVGNCAWVLKQLATCKRRRMRRRLDLLGQLAEPVAVVLLGGIVLTMSLAVLSPILEILWNLV